jgi:gamma-glutamyltranspeptidase/glutathione hydrolase
VTQPPDRFQEAPLVSRGHRAAVTPHVAATRVAVDVMNRGGNAVDAAVAANAVLGVVAPDTCGPGGDLFALVHRPGRTVPAALNASGRAGRGATAAAVREAGHSSIPRQSRWTVTVPGCVDGWVALSDRFGTLGLRSLLEPAIELALGGFAVSSELATSLERLRQLIGGQPSSEPLYPDGEPPGVAARLRRPDLAATLAAIAESGRNGFYAGRVAAAISRATGDILTAPDLERSQADWIEPIGIDVFGKRAWTIPPNSQGYLTLAAAWLFEHLDPPHDPLDPRFVHAAIEAYRAVAWERNDRVADPDHLGFAAAELLDVSRLTARLDAVDRDCRVNWPSPGPVPGGTAFLCVRDDAGMGISLIQSNYYGIGSGLAAGDTGVFLHNRGAGFNLTPGHPNELAPGKRPLHTLSPTLWTSGDRLELLLGTRGGHFQPQTLLQVATALWWAGLEGPDAQTVPRWTTDDWRAPDTPLVYEPRYPAGTMEAVARFGHRPEAGTPWAIGWGPVSIITGNSPVVGAADPRVSSAAASA